MRQAAIRSRSERTPRGPAPWRSAPAAGRGRTAPTRAEAVVALRRGAGNAAVARYLARTPTSLADFAADRESIRVDIDQVTGLPPLEDHFTGGRKSVRTGLSLDIRFSGPMGGMGRTEADRATIETSLRDGLVNLAMTLFNLDGAAVAPPLVGVTRIEELDLTPHGGSQGRYRFTTVPRGNDAAVLLVELIAAWRPGLENSGEMSKRRQRELRERFNRLRFSAAPGWAVDDLVMVQQCLGEIPEPVLARIPDITFVRGHGDLGPGGEAGEYHFTAPPPQRTITLFDFAFRSDAELRFTVAHEVGHAISGRPREDDRRRPELDDGAAYGRATRADGGLAAGITEFARRSRDEHFAESFAMFMVEPDTLRTLRPDTHAFVASL